MATPDLTHQTAYLARLGLEAEPPSPAALARLHRAHVERVPYETLWIQQGTPWSIDLAESFARLATTTRGGYCFHLNGAFSVLLASLGYTVTRHVGGVHGPDGPTADAMTNHLVLMVDGLPDESNPDGVWYVDAGLGDALYEPLPMRPGRWRHEPFDLAVEAVPEDGVGDWHLTHGEGGAFTGMSWSAADSDMNAFVTRHEFLSTDPSSGFVRTLSLEQRNGLGVDSLQGRRLRRLGSDASERWVESSDELFDAVGDVFGIDVREIDASSRASVWSRVQAADEARSV